MRRIACLMLVLCVLFAVTACRSSADGTRQTQLTPTQPTFRTQPPSATTTAPAEDLREAWLDRFLTQTNHEGTIGFDPSAGIQAPGTLPEVQYIPAADQSLVGSRVSILFAKEQQAIPFYYSCDATTGTERLAVVLLADCIPMLMIFETTLGGLNGLCEVIANEDAFEATILSMTNISYEEGMYARNAAYLDEGEKAIDIWSGSLEQNAGVYLGLVGSDYQGNPINILKGAQAEQISQELQTNINVYLRIFTRFDLMKYFEVSLPTSSFA